MASSQMAHLQFVAQCESRFRLLCAIQAQNHYCSQEDTFANLLLR